MCANMNRIQRQKMISKVNDFLDQLILFLSKIKDSTIIFCKNSIAKSKPYVQKYAGNLPSPFQKAGNKIFAEIRSFSSKVLNLFHQVHLKIVLFLDKTIGWNRFSEQKKKRIIIASILGLLIIYWFMSLVKYILIIALICWLVYFVNHHHSHFSFL